jgi:arylsulfatase A-like enzyme
MRSRIGSHDILFVTLDTLRYDVAAEQLALGRTPNLARALPGGRWERRHTPASFTYAAHHAFFAGFLPTPTAPESACRERPYAARFPGSETTGPQTWVFDEPEVVTALANAGYHTICLGGVGFFNLASPLGSVLPSLFATARWEPAFGVTNPGCFEAQLDALPELLPATGPVFLFVNVAAMHQPNHHYLADARQDSLASHAEALVYVDRHIDRLFAAMTGRDRPCEVIICSDHGTAYGEDGRSGHRFAHECVWTVPYGQFELRPGEWS